MYTDSVILGAVGATLGVISLTFCIIQAIIMVRLNKRITQLIKFNTRLDDKKLPKITEDGEDDLRGVENNESAPPDDDYDDVVSPYPVMQPKSPHQPLQYNSSITNCLESYTSDSPTAERGLISPTVAELKDSLALPLKKVFEKSCTLDGRNRIDGPDRQFQKSIRPRALTSNALVEGERSSRIQRTPTDKLETDSTVSTPGANGSPCNNPIAYVVTEIVDVNDTKKRPSVRLRESRPMKKFSNTIQKQLDKPEPFYFGLEQTSRSEGESFQENQPIALHPVKKHDVNKRWRQVLPILTNRDKMCYPCDVTENNCAVSPDKDGPSLRNMSDNNNKYKEKIALKPPPTKKGKQVLEKSSSLGNQNGGTWSPKTLERHRMLLGKPIDISPQRGPNRPQTDPLQEGVTTQYELVELPSMQSVGSVTCAEGSTGYSKIVRQYDGRRRASSTGSSDLLGRQNDKSYNKLMIGI
ncbi:uncharacterized protein LOC129256259 [Lytechinus pictus]|uniref:uncharacterized protein LOC129256259 n=1 Tax=Lytechinus pictus TaxID=7653 RepID=UPI0030BA1666